MRTLEEIEQLAQATFGIEATADPSRLPKQLSFMVSTIGKTVAENHAEITQADFINAVIAKLETFKAVDEAIKRP